MDGDMFHLFCVFFGVIPDVIVDKYRIERPKLTALTLFSPFFLQPSHL